MAALLHRAGIPVVQIGFPEDLDDVRATVRRVAAALGTPRTGEDLIHDMDERIASLGRHPPDTWALYVTPSGVTAGPGTLVDELFRTVGLRNFQTGRGWRPLPLERLAYERPDLIAYASFGDAAAYNRAWTPARHPVARERMSQVPVVTLDGATTACGGWFVIHALEELARSPRP
jgi:iron complex transport system substrate-binding protein